MSRIKKIVTAFKNNPKKTIVFLGVIYGGSYYASHKYRESQMMRRYSEAAQMLGDTSQLPTEQERHITVMLNPAANNGKCKVLFDKYCAPLFHLAGIKMAIVKTEHEGQARDYMDVMDNTSCVVVAGGEGTLGEVVTGLMRRKDWHDAVQKFPVGLLPLGEKNTTFVNLWEIAGKVTPSDMAKAAMAIIKNVQRSLSVMKIVSVMNDLQEDAEPSNLPKPVFATSAIEWGAFRDATDRKDHYWYWAFLKKYVTYAFSYYKELNWDCSADVQYSRPCSGCSKCRLTKAKEVEVPQIQGKWWQYLFSGFYQVKSKGTEAKEETVDYSTIVNEKCGELHSFRLESPSEVYISTCYATPETPDYAISVRSGFANVGFINFILEGWRRSWSGISRFQDEMLAGHIILTPSVPLKTSEGKDKMFNINNDAFELKPVEIMIYPETLTVFAPKINTSVFD